MADFLLIHGSCHGAWCWRDTIPALAALGHRARAIDLPGHGADATPAVAVTLDLYARAIVDAIDGGSNGPVILVGHSMAGYPITAAAELAPEKIERLVYLCAYVPMAGYSLAEMRRMAPSQPLRGAITVAPDRVTFTARPEMARATFYHDVATDTAAWATAQLCPEPVAPQETPLTPDRALGVPRSFIRCTDDRTIPPAFQTTMTAGWPEGSVHGLATSHSPFLADPAGLARTLDAIARGRTRVLRCRQSGLRRAGPP